MKTMFAVIEIHNVPILTKRELEPRWLQLLVFTKSPAEIAPALGFLQRAKLK